MAELPFHCLVSSVFIKTYSAIKRKEFYLPTTTICLRNVRRHLLTILQTTRLALLRVIYIHELCGEVEGRKIYESDYLFTWGCVILLTITTSRVCRCVFTPPPSTFVCIVWWVSTRVQIACTTHVPSLTLQCFYLFMP